MLNVPFNQYILWTLSIRDGKTIKLPLNPYTGEAVSVQDSSAWLDYETASTLASAMGYGLAFVFTENDPLWFVDIDHALEPNGEWSGIAQQMISYFPGAYVEVSQSGTGLHIIGSATSVPDHSCKNLPLGLELYTEGRFVALTGSSATGDAMTDHTALIDQVAQYYFPVKSSSGMDWSDGPVAEWNGPEDDDELIEKMLGAKQSAASVFGHKATVSQLWAGDVDALSRAFPDQYGDRAYDASSADASLASYLAFWTGKDCERMLRLMHRSGLVREKWEREDYLYRTILRACSLQNDVYARRDMPDVSQFPLAKLKGTDSQIAYAEKVRAEIISKTESDEDAVKLAHIQSAAFWIDHKDTSSDDLIKMITPNPITEIVTEPTVINGLQYLPVTQQLELFKGCVYVMDVHRIMLPNRMMLRADQFNSHFGGFQFQFDEQGKVTKKAFEAFTESQVARFPKVISTVFRPELPAGGIVTIDGDQYVNTYAPVITEQQEGDVTPFLTHLGKLLPDQRDRIIFLSYLAGIVQYKGKKFQYAPLLQGVEGNGKTLFTKCIEYAIGQRYCHRPKSDELSEKFNAWIFEKLVVTVEDIYVAEHKSEVLEILKPMITNDRLAKRAMQQDQIMCDNRANFILNSNHKDAIRKSRNDRRFCVFFTAQQEVADLYRDGMDQKYFENLYSWLDNGGLKYVNHYLHHYKIPDEFNPSIVARAPLTTSTEEAVQASFSTVEQEIMEAVEECRQGFRNGWLSSVALDRLLETKRRHLAQNKRKGVLEGLGYFLHPHLSGGRANGPIGIDDGKKPRLYVHHANPNKGITDPAEVVKKYIDDQLEAVFK